MSIDVADAQMQKRGLNAEFALHRSIAAQTAGGGDAEATVYTDARRAEPNVPATDFTTRVLAGAVVFDGAITATGTDYVTVSILAYGPTGTLLGTVVTKDIKANVAKFAVVDLGIAVGGAYQSAGAVTLTVKLHQTGAGAATPTGTVTLELARPTEF